MGRILVLLIIVFLLWVLLRGFFRAQTRDRQAGSATNVRGEDMVTCARCGVNMPRSEARLEAGRYVCQDNPRCLEHA